MQELKLGTCQPKKKNKVYRIRDKWINHYIKNYRDGKITLSQYWASIVDLFFFLILNLDLGSNLKNCYEYKSLRVFWW